MCCMFLGTALGLNVFTVADRKSGGTGAGTTTNPVFTPATCGSAGLTNTSTPPRRTKINGLRLSGSDHTLTVHVHRLSHQLSWLKNFAVMCLHKFLCYAYLHYRHKHLHYIVGFIDYTIRLSRGCSLLPWFDTSFRFTHKFSFPPLSHYFGIFCVVSPGQPLTCLPWPFTGVKVKSSKGQGLTLTLITSHDDVTGLWHHRDVRVYVT
jgi:hypothetical protein